MRRKRDLHEQVRSEPAASGRGHRGKAATEADSAHPVLELQQQAGNRAVQELLRSGQIQAKLTINSPGDSREQEADQIAEQVMNGSPPRPAAVTSSPESEGGTVDGGIENRLQGVLGSSGQPLDPETLSSLEPRFGFDLRRVRVHTNTEAAQSARAISALAYTAGEHVVFGAGAYDPHSSAGRRLLSHELAHVAQNKGKSSPGIVNRQQAPADNYDRAAQQVFHRTGYDDYMANAVADQFLVTASFFGQSVPKVHPEVAAKLHDVEKDLKASQGQNYQAPAVGSTLRPRASMHGFGMAIDFDVVRNPYVLNESGEKDLDKELLVAYDHIAQFMLGKTQSDIHKLRGNRKAFSPSGAVDAPVSVIYDALREESDAMQRYFALKNNASQLTAFLTQEWPAKHPGGTAPDASAIHAQMVDDYEVLGGATASGAKRPTQGKVDRPFAPSSAGGVGDPATGFLNLPKEFVVAMTNAGLAWGAVDFAGGASGDIQHFDLRLSGTGHTVAHLLGAV